NSQGVISQSPYHRLLLIKPEETSTGLRHDVALRPGLTRAGRVVGPDGQPLSGVTAFSLSNYSPFAYEVLPTADFTVRGLNPQRPRRLAFVHREKGLGMALEVRDEAHEPLEVRLGALGAVTGRLLDRDGQPRADVPMRAERFRMFDTDPLTARTDADGRFRIDGLVPGLTYEVKVGRERFGKRTRDPFQIKPGETRDLG